jgi:glutamate--cysteine ligase
MVRPLAPPPVSRGTDTEHAHVFVEDKRQVEPTLRPSSTRCRYVDWVLDVPMYFVYRDGTYLNATGMSFKDWMTGKLPLLPGTYPTLADWEQHLSTVFPEVRMKKFLEMRGADGGPFKRICALPAFWVRTCLTLTCACIAR